MRRSKAAIEKRLPMGQVRRVVLVGVGGTGAILAEHVVRLAAGFRLRDVEIVLVDGDRVEAANVARQAFAFGEIGANKAEAVALRLSGQFCRPVEAIGRHLTVNDPRSALVGGYGWPTLLITATDTLHSRRIAATLRTDYWLDVGNDLMFGQAVLGTTADARCLRNAWWRWGKYAHALALPTIAAMNPAIGRARPPRRPAGCAAVPFARQGYGVNAMAALAASIILKQALVDRAVSTPQVYFDVGKGIMRPRAITRELLRAWKHAGRRNG